MEGTKTYIYVIFENNEPIYVGKSSTPKERYKGHCKNGNGGDYCKIVDFYYDVESVWIQKYWSKGYRLKNKITHSPVEKWEIDDIIINKNI